MPENEQPGTTTATTSDKGTGAQSVNWEQVAKEWEATATRLEERFKGLQTVVNTKEATIKSLTQEAADLKSGKGTVEQQLQALQGQMQTLTTERDQFNTDAATSKKELNRFKAIAKYPALFGDEDQGLLRKDLDGEDFSKWLDTYAARVQASIDRQQSTFKQGSASSAGATRTGSPAEQTLKAQMLEALKKGDMATYNTTRTQLFALDKK